MKNANLMLKISALLIVSTQFLISSCGNTNSSISSQVAGPEQKIDIAEKVFFFGPSLDSSTATISAECDCCGSDLLFQKDSSFFLVSYCLEGDTYSKGKYSVINNKLVLFYDALNITELHDLDSDTSVQSKPKYEISRDRHLNVTADISFFKNRLVIKTTGESESDFAMESKDLPLKKFIYNIKTDSAWIKLLSK